MKPRSPRTGSFTDQERFDLSLLREAVRYRDWVLTQFEAVMTGDILEVGAGIGNFTERIADYGLRVVACEPDAALYQELRSSVSTRVNVVRARLEELDGSERFDTVVLFNVLEHLPDQDLALRALYRLLRPGGSLCVFVPAHAVLFGSLDQQYGHLRRYSRSDVIELLQSRGFVCRRVEYFNPIGAVGWFLVSRLLRRRKLTRSSVRVSERVAIPLGRALSRIGPPPFGQSVVAIATRPAIDMAVEIS
jgi:SAM-dependent methyltransferase